MRHPTGEADAFATFVSALADRLDVPALSGEQLAATVYLSRSHLDRVVRAASGETPAGFRRRVLLERAAFRLLTTDASVLVIAVEAGYSSHEAFTRAFSRAYGTTPSRWRLAPTTVYLDCPNGCTSIHRPGCGCRPAERRGPWTC